jgi:fructoselysine-6-P-deglycase FrlB-like protein
MTDIMTRSPGHGLALIQAEMNRQHVDALRSFEMSGDTAALIAQALGRRDRLILLGMGGSHCVNRCAEVAYRASGVDAIALAASEALYAPPPEGLPRTTILTSQSGNSAEIVRLLEAPWIGEAFGITLEADSCLGRTLPCLLGQGGGERAFAATRSLLITLALHAAVLEALGALQGALRALLAAPPALPDLRPALAVLRAARSIVFSGRGALAGVAEAGALGLLELARMPGFALDGGQFRHGPIEALGPELGVVLLRADEETAGLAQGLAEICVAAGVTPVVLDASILPDLAGCVTLRLPPSRGLAAALQLLPPLQHLLIEVAKTRVAEVGVPLRASKVTISE